MFTDYKYRSTSKNFNRSISKYNIFKGCLLPLGIALLIILLIYFSSVYFNQN